MSLWRSHSWRRDPTFQKAPTQQRVHNLKADEVAAVVAQTTQVRKAVRNLRCGRKPPRASRDIAGDSPRRARM
jgi:hypothetical protein